MSRLTDITAFGFKYDGVQYALKEVNSHMGYPCDKCAARQMPSRSVPICNVVMSSMCEVTYVKDEEGSFTDRIVQLQYLKVEDEGSD